LKAKAIYVLLNKIPDKIVLHSPPLDML